MPDPNARGIKALEDNTRALITHTKAVEAQNKLLEKIEKTARSAKTGRQLYLERSDVPAKQGSEDGSEPTDSQFGPYGHGTPGPYG